MTKLLTAIKSPSPRWSQGEPSEQADHAMNDNLQESASSRGAPGPSTHHGDGFLPHYFKEMAPLPVLKPEQEFEAARAIESLEVMLWVHLLSYHALLPHLLDTAEAKLGLSLKELRPLRRQTRAKSPSKQSSQRYQRKIESLASHLYALDVDRKLLTAIVTDLGRMASGEQVTRRTTVRVASKSFQGFHQRAQALHAAARRARSDFVTSNLRLVVSIARRFNHGRLPLSDLIQEGNIGLIKAVERYDHRRGFRFSTYASWWIRHSISRAIADKGRAVRLPVHMLDAYQRVARAGRELSSKLGRLPTAEEISTAAGISLDKVERIQSNLLDQSLSLDRVISEDDDRKFVELLVDPGFASPTEKIMNQSVGAHVRQILGELKPIEAEVLNKRYGLSDGQELTLKEIGDSYNLSRERIRQIQEQALDKIRQALQQRDAI